MHNRSYAQKKDCIAKFPIVRALLLRYLDGPDLLLNGLNIRYIDEWFVTLQLQLLKQL